MLFVVTKLSKQPMTLHKRLKLRDSDYSPGYPSAPPTLGLLTTNDLEDKGC